MLISRNFLMIALSLVIVASCNKSSNELPAISNQPIVLPISVAINGSERFKVIFEQNKYSGSDTVHVYVENTGQDTTKQIDSMTLLIEICPGAFDSYDNCRYSPVLDVDTLKGMARRRIFSFYNNNILLSQEKIHVAVLQYNDSFQNFSGIYEHPASVAEFFQDTAYKYSGPARGYIQYNGDAVFHLKVRDTAQYDITGRFESDKSFTGNLHSQGVMVTRLGFDSIKTAQGVKVPANFDNGGLHDSLSLAHPLSDNVNHITLRLKK